VPAARDFEEFRAGDPVREFARKGRRRRLIQGPCHHQRRVADFPQDRGEIEPRERKARSLETHRIGFLLQRAPALGYGLRMSGDKRFGKHAADRDVERAGHAFLRHFSREVAQRLLGRLRERGERIRDDQPVELRPVPRGERDGDESTESIAQDVRLPRQSQRGDHCRDPVGVAFHVLAGGTRRAVTRQVDQGEAAGFGKRRGDEVEGRAIREQRMQQHQIAARTRPHDIEVRLLHPGQSHRKTWAGVTANSQPLFPMKTGGSGQAAAFVLLFPFTCAAFACMAA